MNQKVVFSHLLTAFTFAAIGFGANELLKQDSSYVRQHLDELSSQLDEVNREKESMRVELDVMREQTSVQQATNTISLTDFAGDEAGDASGNTRSEAKEPLVPTQGN